MRKSLKVLDSEFALKQIQSKAANKLSEKKKARLTQITQRPSYNSLQENLIDEGCPTAARYFAQLVAKEDELMQLDLRLKKRVCDAPCLLLAMAENVKSAEVEYLMMEDKELTFKLLIQTIHMVKVQDDAFHWLVIELYRITFEITKEWTNECAELLARTHYEYGLVLTEKNDDHLKEAIIQFSNCLKACKGTMWYTNDRDRNILHEDVCVKLAETLLRQAKINSKTDPRNAAHLAHRAVLTIAEVGTSLNKNLYCIAKLRQSEYLIADGNYEAALRVLSSLQSHIMANDSPENKCEFYLWLGICHFRLSASSLALRKFKLSLCLSENYNFPHLKADALLYVGKIHAQNALTQAQAKQCFTEAKDLFNSLKDFENEKLAKFLMAKLRAYQIFPNYIELVKEASWTNFCKLFDLIQWKQKMLPFWNEHDELRHYETDIQCILEEDILNHGITLAD